MAHGEAFSSQQSAVSEQQNQHQRLFTAKDAEDAKESRPNQHQNQRPFTAEDGKESKTLPLSHGKPGQTNADEQERVKQRAEALALKLAQTYEELSRLLERNPRVKRQMTEGPAKEEKVYQKLKQRLKMADMAPRCQWVRQDGTSCGSPQMKQHIYCFAHMQMAEARDLMLKLPPPEDPNAIQVGLMRIQKAVIEDTISMKKAGLLLYSMQLALTNVGQTTFGKAKDEEMVRETVDEEIALSNQQSAFSQDQPQNQTQTFETQRNGGSGGAEDLPRMYADDRGLQGEESSPESEFVPVSGGYGFERVRLRIKPELSGQQRPAQTTVVPEGKTAQPGTAVPHEHSEVHNSSLRDERLPKGPRFASEPLDADTGVGSVFQTEPYANLE